MEIKDLLERKATRREFLREAGKAVVGLYLIGCGTDTRPSPTKPAPEFTPTRETSSSGVTFEFGAGVTPEQQKEIKDGVTIAQKYLSDKAGINIDGIYVFASSSSTEVVDKYLGRTIFPQRSEEDKKNLTRATAFAGEKRDFFIITSSLGWTSTSPIIGIGGPGPVREGRTHTMVHEYFHIFQREVGGYNGPFPFWLNEGGAHYIAARALGEKSVYPYGKIRDGHLKEAASVKQLLKSMESAQGFYGAGTPYADEYSLGFLAVEFLVKDLPNDGVPAIADFWRGIGKGNSWQDSFQSSFGKTPAQFYSEFETWRQKL